MKSKGLAIAVIVIIAIVICYGINDLSDAEKGGSDRDLGSQEAGADLSMASGEPPAQR